MLICTVDTGVVVLAISVYHQISPEELWIAFGSGKSFHYIPIHRIAATLGAQKSAALPFFHSFTGCDTPHEEMEDEQFRYLERFVALMYDTTTTTNNVNEARKHLFTQKGRQIDNIPPTKGALLQHVKRASYQAGFVWGQCLERYPELPSPNAFGWEFNATQGSDTISTSVADEEDYQDDSSEIGEIMSQKIEDKEIVDMIANISMWSCLLEWW
eukprot:gene21241-23314_t